MPTTSQAEEARQKKLEFFRALGQATLEDLEQQQKTAEEKTPRIASMSLFDSSIVSLSSKLIREKISSLRFVLENLRLAKYRKEADSLRFQIYI